MEEIYPLTFEPVFRDYIWGGRRLETLFHRSLPPGIVAESWEVSGHVTSPTTVDAGCWRGRTLPELVKVLGERLVGVNSRDMLMRQRFPLLVKLLDANHDLSVQVHPDDAYAAQHEGGELGKAEMWYVLHAEPGSEVIYGLARGVTRETFREAISRNNVASQLYRTSVRPGDVLSVPAGAVHALLAGAVVAEIQENSDTTYRVYDWGRLDDDGKPRLLHVDRALDVIDFGLVEPGKTRPVTLSDAGGVRRDCLVRSPQFTVERIGLSVGGSYIGACDGATFEIWGCIAGSAQVEWSGGVLPASALRFVLLPATLGEYQVHAVGPATLLRIYVDSTAH